MDESSIAFIININIIATHVTDSPKIEILSRPIRISVDTRPHLPSTWLNEDVANGFVAFYSIMGLTRCCDFCGRLDMNPDLMALHIGDRILEVNGTPLKDQTLSEVRYFIITTVRVRVGIAKQKKNPPVLFFQIEELIRSASNVLQLTIEHDPNALGRQRSFPQSSTRKEPREWRYRKRDEGSHSSGGGRSRQLKRGKGCKERSSSLPRLLTESVTSIALSSA